MFFLCAVRWGISDSMGSDNLTSEICMREIERCRNDRLDPERTLWFLLILGDKYGSRPFPSTIAAPHYVTLRKIVQEQDLAALATLKACFKSDLNQVGDPYVLRPRNIPGPAYAVMQTALRRAAIAAGEKGLLPQDVVDDFVISVTHDELRTARTGLRLTGQDRAPLTVGTAGVKLGAIMVVDRRIHLPEPKAGESAPKSDKDYKYFFDLKDGERDHDAAYHLERLRVAELALLPAAMRYSPPEPVLWHSGGITADTHGNYLRGVLDTVGQNVGRSLLASVESRKAADHPLVTECSAHWEMAKARAESIIGRWEIRATLKQFLAADRTILGAPNVLVLHGESGAGKTSLMSAVAVKAAEALAPNEGSAILIRLLGTSARSSSARPLIQSLAEQISFLIGEDASKKIPFELYKLVDHLKKLLTKWEDRRSGAPLTIFLDSIDQLDDRDQGHELIWLKALLPLPGCVRLVLSTLPEEGGCLDALKNLGGEFCNLLYEWPPFTFVKLLLPSRADASQWMEEALDAWLARDKRQLQPGQRARVWEVIEAKPLPLAFKLAYDASLKWRSWDAPLVLQARVTVTT